MYLMNEINFSDFMSPVLLSIQITLVASILVFILGICAAWFMSGKHFVGKSILETLFMLPLVLPPTVVGFVLLILIGRRSWVGQIIEWLFSQPLVFTWWAGVLASVIISFPLVYMTIKSGFLSVDKDLQDSARSIGASELQVLLWITAPLAIRALITGYILGFARALGEFGATLMVAGSIPGRTQTIPTAIYIAVDSGNMVLAWCWAGVSIVISFLILLFVNRRPR
jgi:molybdate transport system permease protein